MIRRIRLILYFVIGLFLGGWSVLSHAQASPLWSTTGPVVVQNVAGTPGIVGNATPAANSVISNAGAGVVKATGTVSANVGAQYGGRQAANAAMQAVARMSPGTLAKNIVRANAVGIAVTVVAPILIGWGLQYIDGIWVRQVPNGIWKSASGLYPSDSADSTCRSLYTASFGSTASYRYYGAVVSGNSASCEFVYNLTSGAHSPFSSAQFFPSGGSVAVPIDPAEAENAIAVGLQTYPDPASIARAIQSLPNPVANPDPQTLTGPASVASPVSQSISTSPSGVQSITNNQTTYNIAYAGNTATVSAVNTSTLPDGTVKTDPGDPDPTPPVVDTPDPDIPELYERKYPDGFAGVWTTRSAEMKATPLFSLSSVFTPSIGGGSCPSWSFSANIGPSMNYGSGSISPPCWIFPFIKAILLITALVISRRIVFGG